MKKRCLYLATFDPTVGSTGTTTRGRLFLRYFAERYSTTLINLQDKHNESKDHGLVERLESVHSVPYSRWAYFLFSPAFYKIAKSVFNAGRFDFIFADFEKAGWYAHLLSRATNTPYIYSSHNVEYLRYIDFAKTDRLRYPLVPYMYYLERTACRNALLTVAISEPDAKAFRAWIPEDKLKVLPCAFDEDEINPFYNEERTDPPVVLMVGNYRNAGNREGAYRVVHKIIPEVTKQRPDVIFRFIGRDFPSDISHPNVEPAGFVDDLMTEYAQAAVVIAPISIGGGIKIKVIEALASGKFLVTTEKGMEGIDPTGLNNLQITSMSDFPQHILRVLSDRPSKTTANWNAVASGYGNKGALEHLCKMIEHRITNN